MLLGVPDQHLKNCSNALAIVFMALVVYHRGAPPQFRYNAVAANMGNINVLAQQILHQEDYNDISVLLHFIIREVDQYTPFLTEDYKKTRRWRANREKLEFSHVWADFRSKLSNTGRKVHFMKFITKIVETGISTISLSASDFLHLSTELSDFESSHVFLNSSFGVNLRD